ncbi:general substrate transporter [Cunninghamella echinulata]|nr:general substrate transporter [Cunninghamella echinulata]
MNKGLYWYSTLAAVGAVSIGYDFGAVSSAMMVQPFIDRFLYVDSTYRSSLLVSLMLLTATLGGLFSGDVCDKISRKYTILLGAALFAIGCLLETIGYNFGMMLAGRLFVGFGEGFLTNAIPLYHTEISPPAIRGRLITTFSVAAGIGVIIGYFVTFGTNYLVNDWSWRAPFLIHLGFCLIVLTTVWLPFSPRWLIDKGRTKEARQVLAQLYQCSSLDDPIVEEEYNVIVSELEHERSFGNRTYMELFKGTNCRRTLYALFVGNGAAFTGTTAITYYSPLIMKQAGLNDTGVSLVASGASNIVSLVASIFTLIYIDHIGRKLALSSGAFLMAASMFICGGLFQGYHTIMDDEGTLGLSNTNARNTVIAMVFIFQFAYYYSFGPIGYIYPAEILNQRTRSKGLSLAYGLNWAISIFMTFVMPIFMNNTIYGGYYFFGGTCTILLIGTLVMLPETKGRSLEEIDGLFNSKVGFVSDKLDNPSFDDNKLAV